MFLKNYLRYLGIVLNNTYLKNNLFTFTNLTLIHSIEFIKLFFLSSNSFFLLSINARICIELQIIVLFSIDRSLPKVVVRVLRSTLKFNQNHKKFKDFFSLIMTMLGELINPL